jgi:hypothetical protein
MTDQVHIVSKLDAAKRQLETFIRLYFHYGDMVAMHTLVGAAIGITSDINQKRGGNPTLHDTLLSAVTPEQAKEIRSKLNEAQNFFKHADRDHTSALEFNPASTELLAMDAIATYVEITGENPPLFQIYRGWMIAQRDEIFILPEDQRAKAKFAANTYKSLGRTRFFEDMLPGTMKIGA